MARNERLNRILEFVAKKSSLDVETAAKLLSVSAATVRRDFDELADRQLVTRTHGGINAVGKAYELPIRYRTAKDSRGKARIARAAAELVQKDFRIGLNGGTTTTATTTPDVVTSFNDATVDAGSHIWLETTATSGTVDSISLTIEYTE